MDSEEWLDPIFDAVISDVQRSGYFASVNGHEPKRAPQVRSKLHAAVWPQSITPLPGVSTLNTTGGRVLFTIRMYHNMITGNPDLMERIMVKATSNLIRRYTADFTFEGMIKNIDLLGTYGIALGSQGGYLEQDKTNFRIMDLTVPCIVSDIWVQTA